MNMCLRPSGLAARACWLALTLVGTSGCGLLMGKCQPTSTARDATSLEDAEVEDAVLLDAAMAEAGADAGAPVDAARVDAQPSDRGGGSGDAGDAAGAVEAGDVIDDAGPCGLVTLFADDFDEDGLASRWVTWGSSEVQTEQSGGALTITPATDYPSRAYGGVHANGHASLIGQAVEVEVLSTTDPGSAAETSLALAWDTENALFISQLHGSLYCGLREEGISDPIQVGYSAPDQRWWRIRETAGEVHFEVSPMGTSWETLGSIDTPWFASHATIYLQAGTTTSISAPGQARFGAVNPGAPTLGWCSTSSLQDDFSDDQLGLDWVLEHETFHSCDALEEGGSVELTSGTSSGFRCALQTTRRFELEGDEIQVWVLERPDDLDTVFTGLVLSWEGEEQVEFGFVAGHVNISSQQLSLYEEADANLDAWLRVSAQGGSLSFSTRTNGGTWRDIGSDLVTLPPGPARVGLLLRRWSGMGAPPASVSARFDRYNLP